MQAYLQLCRSVLAPSGPAPEARRRGAPHQAPLEVTAQAERRQQQRPRPACLSSTPGHGSLAPGRPLEALHLPHGEVHVWWCLPHEVTDPALLERYERLLDPAERAQVAAAGSAALRKERLLARALVRTTLARYCDAQEPGSLRFQRNQHGKPLLCWPPAPACPGGLPLQFNLSHTAGLIGCAVAAGRLVGLDVEETARATRGSVLRVARRRFAPAEVDLLAGIPDPLERARHFVRVWTLKEAYVKAVGRGLSAPPGLSGFCINLHPSAAGTSKEQQPGPLSATCSVDYTAKSAAEPAGRWQLLLFQPSPAHTAGLCVEAGSLLMHAAASKQVVATEHSDAGGGHAARVTVRMWKTIPLLQEPNIPFQPEVLACSSDISTICTSSSADVT